MNPSAGRPRRETAISMLSCVGISAIPILAYVAVWEWTAPGLHLFIVFGTYWLLGGFALWQMIRVAQMNHWTRKLGAIGIVVGLTVTIFSGLSPKAGCIEPTGCVSELTLQSLPFALGMALTSLFLFLDVRNRANPFAD